MSSVRIFKMLLWQLRNSGDGAKNYVSSLFYQNIQKRLTSQHKIPSDQPAQLEELPKCLSFRRPEMTFTSVFFPAINKIAEKSTIGPHCCFVFGKSSIPLLKRSVPFLMNKQNTRNCTSLINSSNPTSSSTEHEKCVISEEKVLLDRVFSENQSILLQNRSEWFVNESNWFG